MFTSDAALAADLSVSWLRDTPGAAGIYEISCTAEHPDELPGSSPSSVS